MVVVMVPMVLTTAVWLMQVMIDRGRIDEPSSCHMCGNTMSMELVHNRCLFTDKQMVRLQVGCCCSCCFFGCSCWPSCSCSCCC